MGMSVGVYEPVDGCSNNVAEVLTNYFKAMQVFPLLSRDEERTLTTRMIFLRQQFQERALSYPVVQQAFASEVGLLRHKKNSEENFEAHTLQDFLYVSLLKRIVDAQVRYHQRSSLDAAYTAYVAARDTMACSNLRLVVHVAKRYQGKGLEFVDLVEEGNVGLMSAVDRFDPQEQYRFATYATWWIDHTITRTLKEYGRHIRIPSHLHETLAEWVRLECDERGVKRSFDEVYALLSEKDLPGRDVIFDAVKMSVNSGVGSLESLAKKTDNLRFEPADKDSNKSLDEALQCRDEAKILEDVLCSMPPHEAYVLRKLYGLAGKKPMTAQKIAAVFHKSRKRVEQIMSAAQKKLQKIFVGAYPQLSDLYQEKKVVRKSVENSLYNVCLAMMSSLHNCQTLARDFDCTERAVERWIQKLRVRGVNILSTNNGRVCYYVVQDSRKEIKKKLHIE